MKLPHSTRLALFVVSIPVWETATAALVADRLHAGPVTWTAVAVALAGYWAARFLRASHWKKKTLRLGRRLRREEAALAAAKLENHAMRSRWKEEAAPFGTARKN